MDPPINVRTLDAVNRHCKKLRPGLNLLQPYLADDAVRVNPDREAWPCCENRRVDIEPVFDESAFCSGFCIEWQRGLPLRRKFPPADSCSYNRIRLCIENFVNAIDAPGQSGAVGDLDV